MRFSRMITVVGVHAEGELNEVITGGVLDVPGKSVFEKMEYLQTKADWLRQFLLNEPRGKVAQCVNLVVPACDPQADAGFVIIESDYYVPMSGTNTICTTTALLETGMLPMTEPVTKLTLEAPGGLVSVVATCKNGKCESVSFDNVPAFVFYLQKPVEVPGVGTVTVDVAYGGMIYCMVDAQSLGIQLVNSEARDLVDLGEKIKRAAAVQLPCVHPENPGIHTINQTLFAGPLRTENGVKTAKNTVIVSPGRHDRSPCGTGTTARLAIMHAKGQIGVGEDFVHESLIGTKFIGRITGEGRMGQTKTVDINITGRGTFAASRERAEIAAEARRLGVPFIVGITEDTDGGAFTNAQVVVQPDGTVGDRYDKKRRVPFGEYMPLRGLLGALGAPVDLVPRDAVPGTTPAHVDAQGIRMGVAISWEVFFGGRVNEGIDGGGRVIVNPTNGSSYTWTILQTQQVASSRIRAREQGRWVLQVAPTGFSAFVSPGGEVLDRTAVSERRVIERTVDLHSGRTPYSRLGNAPWIWGLLAALGVLLLRARGANRRGRS